MLSSIRRRTATKLLSYAMPCSATYCRSTHLARAMSSSSRSDPLNRPSPPPLPREQQREFEELVRKAQAPSTSDSELHPDAPRPVTPEFEGDVNPTTGEKGGPKREPVGKWTDNGGDWSFKGRVSDF